MAEYSADLTLEFQSSSRGLFTMPWRWTGEATTLALADATARRAARVTFPSLIRVVQSNTVDKAVMSAPPGDHG